MKYDLKTSHTKQTFLLKEPIVWKHAIDWVNKDLYENRPDYRASIQHEIDVSVKNKLCSLIEDGNNHVIVNISTEDKDYKMPLSFTRITTLEVIPIYSPERLNDENWR